MDCMLSKLGPRLFWDITTVQKSISVNKKQAVMSKCLGIDSVFTLAKISHCLQWEFPYMKTEQMLWVFITFVHACEHLGRCLDTLGWMLWVTAHLSYCSLPSPLLSKTHEDPDSEGPTCPCLGCSGLPCQICTSVESSSRALVIAVLAQLLKLRFSESKVAESALRRDLLAYRTLTLCCRDSQTCWG